TMKQKLHPLLTLLMTLCACATACPPMVRRKMPRANSARVGRSFPPNPPSQQEQRRPRRPEFALNTDQFGGFGDYENQTYSVWIAVLHSHFGVVAAGLRDGVYRSR